MTSIEWNNGVYYRYTDWLQQVLGCEGGPGMGAARPWCHHFGVTPFYDTNPTKKDATGLTSLEMFSTLEWTKM